MVDQLTLQPFFDSLGQPSSPHAVAVNAAATARMERILKSPVDAPGRGILLRAPRAGFGKTHLLSQVQQSLGTTHEFLPLNPLDGSRTDAPSAIEAALRRLTRQLPAGGGLTALDLQARRLFSLALQPLVSSGEVPCQDREAALTALRQRPVETFDFHHSQAVTAHWTKENFEVLGPRLALELSRRTGTSLNESSFWLASLFRFSIAVPEHPGRTGMIIQSSTSEAGVERYGALLALLSLIGRVVVAADDLEGMHADTSAALRFASFLASVRQDAPRVDVVVSVNDDIWESAFRPALSGGLQDRLGEVEIRLEPLDQAAAVALLESRMPGRAGALGHRLSLSPGEFYARRVLRRAAELEEDAGVSATPLLVAVPAVVPVEAPAGASEVETPRPAPVAPPEATVPVAPPAHAESVPAPAEVFAATAVPPVNDPPPSLGGAASPFTMVDPTFEPEIAPEPVLSVPATAFHAEPIAEVSLAAEASHFSSSETVSAAARPPARRPGVSPFSTVLDYDLDEATPAHPQMAQAPNNATPPQPPALTPVDAPAAESSGPPPLSWPNSDPEPDTETPEPVAAHSGGDRIDDLLRQFRERYGRE
ncbi:hypothetical protein [Haloferula sp. BvORR071]|uniref:hypothetical protein n=1 Tax=Haloferula sp. BvORR071 TaxID=1396141 RepID=UPI000552648D|nr:hypothetical protein [Haloferula sp. BvORR071]